NRGRTSSAGIVLGLGLFKFQFVIPLAAMLAWHLGRKFIVAFAGTAAVLFGISWKLVGSTGLQTYWQMLLEGTPEMLWRMPNLRGMVESLGVYPAVAVALSIVVAIWCMVKVEQVGSGGFALAIVCSLLVSHHAHVYDCLLLIIPTFYALEAAIAQKKQW